ncbi:site-2 protease family protein [Candidatus Woesearchaeota archaeon]|nr:site-2 protease family protein [Candidatus Woesearchaeota archaeon]
MVDINYILFGIFVILMLIFLRKNKHAVQVQKILYPLIYFVMYRTKWGLGWMDRTAKKYPNLLRWIFSLGVIIGFLGMIFISAELVMVTIKIFTQEKAPAAVQPVLPFDVKGVYYVPFVYWILAIFIIALVHEFSHGVAARVYNIPLKSSGFAFVGLIVPIIPAAFVEPDEKKLIKHRNWEQLSVFAAGPLANILTAILIVIISGILIAPVSNMLFHYEGIKIKEIVRDSAAAQINMQINEVITGIDDNKFKTLEEFRNYLGRKNSGDEIIIKTDKGSYQTILGSNPENNKNAFLGVVPVQNAVQKYTTGIGFILTKLFTWFSGFLIQLYLLSLGIGLFNLVPIGPIDGGRMFKTIITKIIPARAQNICSFTSSMLVFLILFHVFRAFVG